MTRSITLGVLPKALALSLVVCLAAVTPVSADDWQPIPRRLPPKGIAIPDAERHGLEADLAKLDQRLKAAGPRDAFTDPLADVEIYAKAVHFALRFDEFYKESDFKLAHELLATANKRLDGLKNGQTPWVTQHGLVVRGYRSPIDGSAQPYGLEIPQDVDLSKPVPLYVWLHGRGDQSTDLHFIRERETRKGQIAPAGAIVLDAFGRQCLGYKSSGEVDVMDAIASVEQRYKIDPDRVALLGFSMGGAGAWHIGAHYTDHFAAVHTGAGFVDVKRYQKLTPDKYPAWYEQELWGLYDVPDYVRNLFNVPLIAYSGEIDAQRASAEIMAGEFRAQGRELTHLIGPNMPHKYDPKVLADVMARVKQAVDHGRDRYPKQVMLQTRTLRYNHMDWVAMTALGRHWEDARIDAEAPDEAHVVVKTKNVDGFALTSPWPEQVAAGGPVSVQIDGGQAIEVSRQDLHDGKATFQRGKDGWAMGAGPSEGLRKRPGLQGPIDDALMDPFLVVTPSGRCASDAVQKWVEFELKHFQDRWRAVYRGDLRTKKDTEVTPEDIRRYHLILWGDAQSNRLIGQVAGRLPIRSAGGSLTVGRRKFDAATHVPLLIYPNPLNPTKYVVLNSGPTHREAHDSTNSLQNPKLPDWAIVDVTVPPSASAPGKVVDADFFDEHWQLRPPHQAAQH